MLKRVYKVKSVSTLISQQKSVLNTVETMSSKYSQFNLGIHYH